jgi:hypothetical protein
MKLPFNIYNPTPTTEPKTFHIQKICALCWPSSPFSVSLGEPVQQGRPPPIPAHPATHLPPHPHPPLPGPKAKPGDWDSLPPVMNVRSGPEPQKLLGSEES